MYTKSLLFYTVVLTIQSVLSGVNIDNATNHRNTNRIYLNQQHNTQNGQNMNRPVYLSNISGNNNHYKPNYDQQHQNVKNPSHNRSLQPHRQPLNKVQNYYPNGHVLPNQRVENYNTGKLFSVTSPRNEEIEAKLQNNLNLNNGRNNHLQNYKMTPFVPVMEHKNISITKTGIVENENRKITISSTLKPAPSVPHIAVNKEHSNKMTYINNAQRSVSHALERQKSVDNQQNQFMHKGNIQPQGTLQDPRNNIQTNHSPQNKRFVVIHDNGYVEYFYDLEIILRKYPNVRITDSIRELMPIQNRNVPRPMAHNTVSNANIKINRPLQHPNVPNDNVIQRMKVNLLNSTLKPKIQTNIQKKDSLVVNKANNNFGSTQTSKSLQVEVDNKKLEMLQAPIKPRNNIQINPMNAQENKEKNVVKNTLMTKNPEKIVGTKSNDVYNKNNITTPFKNITTVDVNKQKSPTNALLNSGQKQPHEENKTYSSSVIPKSEQHFQTVASKHEEDDLHLNKPNGVTSPIVSQNKNTNKTGNSTSVNKSEILNNSSSNHDTEEKSGETKSNCTKHNGVKNKLETKNIDIVKKTVKEEIDDDYDEDLLSLAKSAMWFSTTDPEFWNKLVSVEDAPNFLYIINVQSQPKIERDRKTTIHANGTIVEEITETIWDAEDDVSPKITKTIKVTPANPVTDGT